MTDIIDDAIISRLHEELAHMRDHVEQLPTLNPKDACLALECLARRSEHFTFFCRSLKAIQDIRNERDDS